MRYFAATVLSIALSTVSIIGGAQAQDNPARVTLSEQPRSIVETFSPEHRNLTVMQIEAAIASAQAKYGVIPMSAAREINATAQLQYAPLDAVAAERRKTNHRMVALLNVWKTNLSPESANYLHYGVTTVDIYGTTRVLQIRDTINILIDDMRDIEEALLKMADENKDTVMVGRTIGQHALPITFGKKVSTWAAQNRRNIERLKEVQARIETRGVLKGAVGTHLGLGEYGVEIENEVSRILNLSKPEPADWQGSRDVFAEYGQVLALIAKSHAAMAEEIFRLQITDIGELGERQRASAVGSSTMPHKKNPRHPERVIGFGRKIPRLAEVLLDDVTNYFERDNTSGPSGVIEDISLESADLMRATQRMINSIEVNTDRMRENLDRTDGMIMAQRIVYFLADDIDKAEVEARVRLAANLSYNSDKSFREALLEDPVLGTLLVDQIDELLDPRSYLGLAREQVDATKAFILEKRRQDDIRY